MKKLLLVAAIIASFIIFTAYRIYSDYIPPDPRPNIVVIMTDDQRWDTLKLMPNVVSELVEKGVTFSNSFVSIPMCCPSRASFYSGLWAHNTGVVFNRPTSDPVGGAPYNGGIVAFDWSTSINLKLQNTGYKTALIGKVMNSNDLYAPKVPAGWDRYATFVNDGFNFFDYTLNIDGVITPYGSTEAEYSTDVLRDLALKWLDGLNTNEPFFLVFTPYAPHFDHGFYDTTPAPRHAGVSSGLTWTTPPSFLEPDVSDKPEWLQDMNKRVTSYLLENIDDFRYQTVDSLMAVDEAVLSILKKLDEMGVTKKTMVVYTSDNGYLWGEHRFGMKGNPYEESIRVPLVIRYPSIISAPFEEERLVSNVDLAPTFAAMAGINSPQDFNGKSLLPVLDGTANSWRTGVLVEGWLPKSTIPNILIPNLFPPVPDYAMTRTKDFMYADYQTGKDELYDLRADPYELNNVIDDPAYTSTKSDLQAQLQNLLAE